MAEDQELAGKSVLVTGASSGIGWETAVAFARKGARLALLARRQEKLAELARSLRPLGPEPLLLAADVRRCQDCASAVERTLAAYGRLDILVNNAGINEYRPFVKQSIESMESIIRTNVLGVLYMLRAALPPMLQQKQGHVVNIASLAGHLGVPGMAVYCASKFAIVGLTQALRTELYRTGVTLTAFCPGTVATPMAAEALKDPRVARMVRAKSPADVAERIVRACVRRTPEVLYGEMPGAVLKIARFFPRLSDWATYTAIRRYRPQAFRF